MILFIFYVYNGTNIKSSPLVFSVLHPLQFWLKGGPITRSVFFIKNIIKTDKHICIILLWQIEFNLILIKKNHRIPLPEKINPIKNAEIVKYGKKYNLQRIFKRILRLILIMLS